MFCNDQPTVYGTVYEIYNYINTLFYGILCRTMHAISGGNQRYEPQLLNCSPHNDKLILVDSICKLNKGDIGGSIINQLLVGAYISILAHRVNT